MKFEFVEIILFFLCVQCFISMQVKKKVSSLNKMQKKRKNIYINLYKW